jgi:glycerate-2-kinase
MTTKATKPAPKKAKEPVRPRRKRTHVRMDAPAPTPDEDEQEDMDIPTLLQNQLNFLQRLQTAADEAISAGKVSPTFIREARDISKAIASVVTEQRKWEKHEKDRVQIMTPQETHELVAEYLRECDYDGRKVFRDIIIELDGERSLLS